jgi:hypothetical protein
MANNTTGTKATKTEAPQFIDLGALFESSSDTYPYTGLVSDKLLEALGLEAPEGKEYKIFAKIRESKKGKPYLSVYAGLCDKR